MLAVCAHVEGPPSQLRFSVKQYEESRTAGRTWSHTRSDPYVVHCDVNHSNTEPVTTTSPDSLNRSCDGKTQQT